MKSISVNEICKITGGTLLFAKKSENPGEIRVSSVIINSREGKEGSLFIPIIGENTDAHDYIPDAYSRGTRVTLTSRNEMLSKTPDMVYICVENTLLALQQLGTGLRNDFRGTVIGITGSVGKSTTKEMVAAALESQYTVLKTYGNKNSQIGVPLMMLELEDKYRYAVIEMGMSLEGEMKKLADIVRPSAAVLTNIGVAHIGQLGTQENIRREKLQICSRFQEQGGTLYVNGEDPLLKDIQKLMPDKKITVKTFGLNSGCDYYAEKIETAGEYTEFVFCSREGSVREPVLLPVIGMHNVIDAVSALAVADGEGLSADIAKKGLELYRPMSMRGRTENINGIILIDDTYNASPDSMKSGLDMLGGITNTGRKIAVLADILELGDYSAACHYEVGAYAALKHPDILIAIGTEAAQIAKGAREKRNGSLPEVYYFTEQEEAYNTMLNSLKPGDIIYLKGSRGMHLDQTAKKIREQYTV